MIGSSIFVIFQNSNAYSFQSLKDGNCKIMFMKLKEIIYSMVLRRKLKAYINTLVAKRMLMTGWPDLLKLKVLLSSVQVSYQLRTTAIL